MRIVTVGYAVALSKGFTQQYKCSAAFKRAMTVNSRALALGWEGNFGELREEQMEGPVEVIAIILLESWIYHTSCNIRLGQNSQFS